MNNVGALEDKNNGPCATCSIRIRNSKSAYTTARQAMENRRNRSTAPHYHAICCQPVGNIEASTVQFSSTIRIH